jgi:hypothetical protein
MRLHVEFMSGSRSPYAKPQQTLPPARGDAGLFWWTIAIFLLLALTTFSWLGSLYIFRHPEKPKNYRVLAKFQKLPPLKKFNERTVPQGKFHNATEVYNKYFGFSDKEIDVQNDLFKRNYIRNYDDAPPVYVRGTYRIYKVEDLSPSQPFMSGLVVRAKSVDVPNVSIEFVFPTESLPRERLTYGDDLMLDTNESFASVIHISSLPESSLCLTVVPLTYNYFSVNPADVRRYTVLSPPVRLNMDAPWPVTDDTPVVPVDPLEAVAGTPALPTSAEGKN